jgi:hypothetical protein
MAGEVEIRVESSEPPGVRLGYAQRRGSQGRNATPAAGSRGKLRLWFSTFAPLSVGCPSPRKCWPGSPPGRRVRPGLTARTRGYRRRGRARYTTRRSSWGWRDQDHRPASQTSPRRTESRFQRASWASAVASPRMPTVAIAAPSARSQPPSRGVARNGTANAVDSSVVGPARARNTKNRRAARGPSATAGRRSGRPRGARGAAGDQVAPNADKRQPCVRLVYVQQ